MADENLTMDRPPKNVVIFIGDYGYKNKPFAACFPKISCQTAEACVCVSDIGVSFIRARRFHQNDFLAYQERILTVAAHELDEQNVTHLIQPTEDDYLRIRQSKLMRMAEEFGLKTLHIPRYAARKPEDLEQQVLAFVGATARQMDHSLNENERKRRATALRDIIMWSEALTPPDGMKAMQADLRARASALKAQL